MAQAVRGRARAAGVEARARVARERAGALSVCCEKRDAVCASAHERAISCVRGAQA